MVVTEVTSASQDIFKGGRCFPECEGQGHGGYTKGKVYGRAAHGRGAFNNACVVKILLIHLFFLEEHSALK